jgi:hypothetical protein
MSNKSGTSTQVISLPKGGGALHGLGEKFSPDLHTGTGNFTIPITLPAGRNGFQPQLNLVYSTGAGNGPFGLGWNLSVPGISRKTSQGVPQYQDNAADPQQRDIFILSGAEDLVPASDEIAEITRYCPRTEGLFAQIEHHQDDANNFWQVHSKDGLISFYGTPTSAGNDPAVIAKPDDPRRIFAWKLTETRDPFGNRIVYEYDLDEGQGDGHRWKQPLLKQIRYADYADQNQTKFLVSVTFDYETRFDAFSEYRSGFEVRTSRRCATITIRTQAGQDRAIRTYAFEYGNDPYNGLSLLRRVKVIGYDDQNQVVEELPPLEFGYTTFEPQKRKFEPITGPDLPPGSLGRPEYELADLIGNGLPDVLEMNGTIRYWRNLGHGHFDRPRAMADAPAHALADPGAQMIDADGDGRIDLLVTSGNVAGFYPLNHGGIWDRRSFKSYRVAPSFNLEDPEVKLVDLNGDGVTDIIRSGTALEFAFNDPHTGWSKFQQVPRQSLDQFPDVTFSDPRVKWGDMSGDGLQDIVLVYNGAVAYWPNLGWGKWGWRMRMRHSPRFPYGYDPKRILVGDVDGDGLADIVYIDHSQVIVWLNQSGNSWSDPVTITGTPPITDLDAVRLVDLKGSGVSGILWSADANGLARHRTYFLDLTGGGKPYLLNQMDNHMGAVTRVQYASSIEFYLADEKKPETRWRTYLPFPVQVVARVEVIDAISKGKLTTEYRYHHGYWDGAEREFRGFGLVEQFDTETFVDDTLERHFSPPTLTKTWFHQGPVGEEFGEWQIVDLRQEFWVGDPPLLEGFEETIGLLRALPRRVQRDAIRALRGMVLRTELYALDGSERQDRPYTITETLPGLAAVVTDAQGQARLVFDPAHLPAGWTRPIFFPHTLAQRTTQWERGYDPLTQFTFTNDYDDYGQPRRQTHIVCPRGWRNLNDRPGQPYLATRSRTEFARPVDSQTYLWDRVAKVTIFEIRNEGTETVQTLKDLHDNHSALAIFGQTLNFYDGDAWFVATERRRYDFHDNPGGRGLVRASRNALGRDTLIIYDEPYWVLPSQITDAANLTTTAKYNYRVWQPETVTDPNKNVTEFRFSPQGLLKETWVKGLPSKGEGDLRRPSIVLEYDFLAFEQSPPDQRRPIFVRTIKQVHHDTEADVPHSELDQTIETVEYSDGFGRLIQTRTQAEEVIFGDLTFGGAVLPADQGDTAGTGRGIVSRKNNDPATGPNVVVSGWQVYDNKGRVVEKYEPFFSTGWAYVPPADKQFGQQVTMFYDPRGQVIRTLNPDGSEQRVIYGVPGRLDAPDVTSPDSFEPTPWETYTYDPNDLAPLSFHPIEKLPDGSPKPLADRAPSRHHYTPASILVDALGRTIRATERNGPNPAADWFVTTSTYDIRGNLLTITDALGREAFSHVYDLANHPLRVVSLDAGTRRRIFDTAGNLIEQRDSKRALILHAYDELNRPTRRWARDGQGHPLTLREKLIYGDSAGAGMSRQKAAQQKLLGRLYKHYDEAGVVTFESYDFKGNILEKTRQVIKAEAILAVFQPPPSDWQVPAFYINWQPPPGVTPEAYLRNLLDQALYQISNSYDALNRIKTMDYPADVTGQRRRLRPFYNRAGALVETTLDGQPYVSHIAYNAKGQRTLIAYGNNVMTRYAYDERSFRLVRLRTERYTQPNPKELAYQFDATLPLQERLLQDFAYEYDLAGNITALHDRTLGSGWPSQPDQLDRTFSYDPLYRLLSATGRECDPLPSLPPWDDAFRGHDVTRTRLYEQTYHYDAVGNMTELRHIATGGDFTRQFNLTPHSNRLSTVKVGATSYAYDYDDNGNLLKENSSRHFEWDHSDRLKVFRTQAGQSEPSLHAHYLYDVAGQRVMKLVRRQGGAYEVTVYIGVLFEHHRWREGNRPKQNNHLHLLDNQSRIALLRLGDLHPDDKGPAVQYHLGDHLGSSNIVIGGADGQGNTFINREEFYPYGETSFGSFGRKCYRFTGKERDEESGLYYHGARYYAPWVLVSRTGVYQWLARATDRVGNVTDLPLTLRDDTGPELDINYPPNNVKVPHDGKSARVNLLGTAKDAWSGVNRVEWSVDGGPSTPALTNNGWAEWTAPVIFGPNDAGRFHRVTVRAIDNVSLLVEKTLDLEVARPYQPREAKDLVSVRAYLQDLLEFSETHARTRPNDTALRPSDLIQAFYQPFDRLAEPLPLTDLGNRPVNQVRLAIEVLRRYLSSAPTGLVAHWMFDEGSGPRAADVSGNGHHGYLHNAGRAVGRTGGALQFDGATSHVEIANPAALVHDPAQKETAKALSISAWIHPTGSGSGGNGEGGILVGKEGEFGVARFTDGTIRWAFANTDPGWKWIDTKAIASLNTWSHVAVTFDNGTVTTYLNGSLAHTYPGKGAIGTAAPGLSDLRLGARQSTSQHFQGLLEDVRIYRVAIDAATAAALANTIKPPVAPVTDLADAGARYCQTAYEVLLNRLGASYEEIRLARGAEAQVREDLAARLGIRLSPVRPDELDELLLRPNQITESVLESLCGLVNTQRDPLQPSPVPKLLAWQIESLRAMWLQQDHPPIAEVVAPPLIIDPDVIGQSDLRNANQTDKAFELWEARRNWLQQAITGLQETRAAHASPVDALDALIEKSFSITAAQVWQLAADQAQGVDIRSALTKLYLTPGMFRRLLRVRALAQTGTVTDYEWEDVDDILLGVQKAQMAPAWRTAEMSLVLSPDWFVLNDNSRALPRWRVPGTARLDWQDRLQTRFDQQRSVEEAYWNAVSAAEEVALPLLRDALVAVVAATQGLSNAADWLTEQLLIDFKGNGSQQTTRIEQAIETIQVALTSLRMERFATGHLAAQWYRRPDQTEADFDEEWKWMGSYASWRAAMFVFFFPENVLLPGLLLRMEKACSPPYQNFMTKLREKSRLRPDAARKIVEEEYLSLLKTDSGIEPEIKDPSFKITDQLEHNDFEERRKLSEKLMSNWVDAATNRLKSDTPPHLKEVFYFVPMQVALQLQKSGEYVAALDWYQTVYAFNLLDNPATPVNDERKIYSHYS